MRSTGFWPELLCAALACPLVASHAPAQGPVGATSLASCDEAFAVGGHGGVELWIEGRPEALGTQRRNVFALAFAGDVLVEAGGAAARHAMVRAWDWRAGRLLWHETGGTDLLYGLAVVDGTIWAGGADSKIALLDLATGELETVLEAHTGAVLALAAAPDGRTLVSAGADRSLRVWDVAERALVRSIHNHGDAVHALAWSPDGRYLASGSADRTVRLFQPRIGRLVRIIRHGASVLALDYEDDVIRSGAADGRVRLIEPSSDRILAERDLHAGWVVGLGRTAAGRVSVDDGGRLLLSGPNGPVELAPGTSNPAAPANDGERRGRDG